jgi:hypothetical protein
VRCCTLSISDHVRVADFILGDIGTADAIDVKVRADASSGALVECVEFPGYRYRSCDATAPGIPIIIPIRPKDRPEVNRPQGAYPNDWVSSTTDGSEFM